MGHVTARYEGECFECGTPFKVGETIVRGPYFLEGKKRYFGVGCHADKRNKATKKKDNQNYFERIRQYNLAKEGKKQAPAPAPKEQTAKKQTAQTPSVEDLMKQISDLQSQLQSLAAAPKKTTKKTTTRKSNKNQPQTPQTLF